LFRRMAPRIRLYGLRHLRDEHAAEDLTQHVLIATIEALRAGRLRDPERLASFVLGTCRMTVLDLRRSAQRKERLLTQFGAERPPSVQPSMPLMDRERLAGCVQDLKERERTVIVMTFFDEQTSESKTTLDELKRNFGDAVLPPIHRATILREAPAEGKLVYELDPQHRATREYYALSQYTLKYS